LIGLNEQKLTWAFGLAATQASGLREMFGTMTKSFHPGRAAQNGAMAAFLAEAGFDSSEHALEAPRGFANVLSTKQDYSEILDGLGARWEAVLNSYKPFACGIVIHPTIDGCRQLRAELGDDVGRIEKVELVAHPLVLELTGKKEPRTGLEGKFSVFHAAAAALIRGDGSPTVFTEEAVSDPALVAMRRKVEVRTDPSCHEASVEIVVTLADGRCVEKTIERAIGSSDRPLTIEELEQKFIGQAAVVLGEEQSRSLMKVAWDVSGLKDVAAVARASVPGGPARVA
jgi:2-methylcitrate dehydratase PrpD